MSKNFILEEKNILTKKECNYLIKECKKRTNSAEHKDHGYNCFDLERTQIFVELTNLILPVLQKYKKKYPQINLTKNKWAITNLRFKHFKPGKSFEKFHSEHSWKYATRLLNIQIYLSDHNCGTEFYNKKVIKSEIGKLVIFPSYFTHTHRGQKCPDKKNRYIITGYINFLDLT
tara:strand:+ start:3284 stop:3805 length:522 start_codon:yes stop_codon:yes gene_type:complete